MEIRRIGSTDAQNNFGKIIDSVTKDHVGFIIERRGNPEVWIISNNDLKEILSSKIKQKEIGKVLKTMTSRTEIGESINLD